MTFAPSSSTSRLTSRSRSGFAFSVCTPWAVRLVSMMYVGIPAPPRSRTARLYSGCLIEVEERRAQHDDRPEDALGERAGDVGRLAAARVDRERHHPRAEVEGDRERRQAAERVDVVGLAELVAALQGVDDAGAFDHRGR